MNLTVKFTGHVADVVDLLVKKGVVATKTEALRLGVLELEQKYLTEAEKERKYDEWAIKEMDKTLKLEKEGKLKWHTQEEFEKIVHDEKPPAKRSKKG